MDVSRTRLRDVIRGHFLKKALHKGLRVVKKIWASELEAKNPNKD